MESSLAGSLGTCKKPSVFGPKHAPEMDQVCLRLSGIEVGTCYIRTHISPDVPYHVCSLFRWRAFCHALINKY